MRMAICIGATGLILDGGDDSQYACAAAIAINAEAVWPVELGHGLGLRMAPVTGFRVLVDDVADLGGIGGVADTSFLVENADANHARLVANGVHDLVKTIAIVAHHVIGGAALDHVADSFGAAESRSLEVLAVQANAEV